MTAANPAQTPDPVVVSRDWLHQFALVVRHATLSTFTAANTCILTTRVGLAALDRVGVSARPAPVFVTVHNRDAWALSERGVPARDWPSSAHSVGIDERSPLTTSNGGWNGHLVLIVRQPDQPRLLVDLTADQFDRPIRNLVVGGPVFMDIPAASPWTPQDPLFTIIGGRDSHDGAIVSYRPMPPGHPEAKVYQTSRDWVDYPEAIDDYVAQILDRLPAPDGA